MVRIKADYNVQTREYRNVRLLEFVEHEPRLDEGEFKRLTDRGAKAWASVPDANAWVESLRGNEALDGNTLWETHQAAQRIRPVRAEGRSHG